MNETLDNSNLQSGLPPLDNVDLTKSIQPQNVNQPSILKTVDLQFKSNRVPVNNDIVDDISDLFKNPPQVNPQKADSSVVDDKTNKKLEKTELAYKESSAEAIRLATERKRYEPFIPILEKMRQDPKLVQYVDGYLEKGAVPPNIVEQLGLDEDFEYKGADLVNPNSDSYRVNKAIVDNAVAEQFAVFTKENNISMKQMKDEQAFKTEMKMSTKDFKKFSEFANSKVRNLGYADMYDLYTKKERETGIAKSAQDATLQQLQRAEQLAYPQGKGIPTNPQVNSEMDWMTKIFGNLLEKKEDSLHTTM